MEKYWEQQPIHVDRKCPSFYNDLLSYDAITQMLKLNHVEWTKTVDIQFMDGVNVTAPTAPTGRVSATEFWKYFERGCGFQIRNPQTFLPTIRSMIATFQEYFQCAIDCSIHLGSKYCEGYAPRCDEAEIFILQIEGKNHWCVYKPSSPSIQTVSVLDVEVTAGDLLYVPRGFIHEAITSSESNSLHLRLSVYRRQTFGDLGDLGD